MAGLVAFYQMSMSANYDTYQQMHHYTACGRFFNHFRAFKHSMGAIEFFHRSAALSFLDASYGKSESTQNALQDPLHVSQCFGIPG